MDESKATWLNTYVGIVGIIVGVLGLIVGGLSLFGVTFKWVPSNIPYFISPFLTGIIALQWYLRPVRYLKEPSCPNIANIKLYRDISNTLAGRIRGQVEQLNEGFVTLYGTQVREFQVNILEKKSLLDMPYIRAFDLTSAPEVLLTRKEYHKQNKFFIDHGGKIDRIFLINTEDLTNEAFMLPFVKILHINAHIKSSFGVFFLNKMPQEHKLDFICFGKSALMLEGRSGNEAYSLGHSDLFFSKKNIERHIEIFSYYWNFEGKNNPPTMAKELMRVYTPFMRREKNFSDCMKHAMMLGGEPQ